MCSSHSYGWVYSVLYLYLQCTARETKPTSALRTMRKPLAQLLVSEIGDGGETWPSKHPQFTHMFMDQWTNMIRKDYNGC